MAGKKSWNSGLITRDGLRPDEVKEVDTGYSTPCLIFTGRPASQYAQLRVGPRWVGVHRYAWERVHGPMSDGLVIDHLCNQPRCCNVDHLRATSQAENIRRSAVTKLTHADVEAIRADRRAQRVIAAVYRISQQQVSKIKRGERWVAH